ncbi:sugar phosphate isomerase/epimerase [Devosia sp. UYZn731]|uniref:sugar phosphate isomerase/epimerase family protein n=1 Tax=Devosia sp. UYZn731 TaxID=3156345 RepID=UPI003395B094
MELGIFAKTFEGSSPEIILQQAATAGYQAVQYNMACSGIGSLPTQISDAVAAAVSAASAATGIRIAAVSATYNMTHPDLAVRANGRGAFAAIASQARTMGTDLVTVCTGSMDPVDQWRRHPENDSSEAWIEMLREFGRIIPIAEQYDLVLGIEPELSNIISSTHKARVLIDTLKSDRIKIVLDAANLFEVESDHRREHLIFEAIHVLDDAIVMAHAKDRKADGSFTAAGKGVIDFPRYVELLASIGFSGTLVTHGLAADEAAGVARYLAPLVKTA